MASTTIDNLPLDVLSNILIRLPAKPLARMRCVSKPLNALLSEPSFIKSHLHRSIKNNDEILLVFADGFCFDSKLYPITAHPCKSPHLVIPDFIQIPVDANLSEWPCYNIHGSVNGLICLSFRTINNFEPILQIWNPSLSAMLTLPPYGNPFGRIMKIDIQFGFGFDPKTDDYIVIKFMTRRPRYTLGLFIVDKDGNLPYDKILVEIYSLRKCSWESITERFTPNVTEIVDRDEVCLDGHDGHLHWLGYLDECYKQQTIVAFDLGDKTFSEICLPVNNVDRRNTLGILNGKPCACDVTILHFWQIWVESLWVIVFGIIGLVKSDSFAFPRHLSFTCKGF
ncbi:hypothetical protein OSB04_018057 [Centaurea solstitialis]|uniref:F-box domain-containing protein n=1 Tax=Centaurea solstitialis TaxID=347529 RepID=A0AA38WB74_9ASTR|nr:hypothetical protein OSB04_018057 [Centaurea solstitialis]